MLPVPMTAEIRHQADGISKMFGRRQPDLRRIIPQKAQLVIREHQFGIAFRHLTAEKRHQHDAPRDHTVDGNGALQPVGSAEG